MFLGVGGPKVGLGPYRPPCTHPHGGFDQALEILAHGRENQGPAPSWVPARHHMSSETHPWLWSGSGETLQALEQHSTIGWVCPRAGLSLEHHSNPRKGETKAGWEGGDKSVTSLNETVGSPGVNPISCISWFREQGACGG